MNYQAVNISPRVEMTKKVLDKNQKVVKTIRTIVINILTFLESKALALDGLKLKLWTPIYLQNVKKTFVYLYYIYKFLTNH